MPPSLREWLPEDHLAWFVLEAVGELDLAAFYAAYRDDGCGRAAQDPAMMVALLVYAYAIGVRSSRGDRAALPRGRRVPGDHRQPGARSRDDRALPCASRDRDRRAVRAGAGVVRARGLVKVGVVAVDGTKIAAAATHHATRSYEQIAREILEEAAAHRRRRGRAARRRARRRAAGGSCASSGDRRKRAARGQAGAGRRTRGRRQAGRARPRRAAARVPAPARAGLGARARV